jgi:crossover junction endodeoxyribonuclease RusA
VSQSFTITLPAGLPLLNANRRTHHHIRAMRTRLIRAAAIEAVAEHRPLMEALAAAKPGVLFQRARIVGYLRPARAGRADPANWYPSFKAAVDGLVDAGLLEDDDHTRLVGPDMRLGSKVAGGQLVLVIHDASDWTDAMGCQTPEYTEGPCHCAHCDPWSNGLVAGGGAA